MQPPPPPGPPGAVVLVPTSPLAGGGGPRTPPAPSPRHRYRLCWSYFVFVTITVVYSIALVIYGATFASSAAAPVGSGVVCIVFGLLSMRFMWKTYRMPETEWVRRGIPKFPNNVRRSRARAHASHYFQHVCRGCADAPGRGAQGGRLVQ